MGERVFLKMSYHPCISGCDCYLVLRTVRIAASRAWVFSTLRKLSWMVHVLLVERRRTWKKTLYLFKHQFFIYPCIERSRRLSSNCALQASLWMEAKLVMRFNWQFEDPMALRGLVTRSFECFSLVKYLLNPQTDIKMINRTNLK